MTYSNLENCINDLEKNGMLKRISKQVDPNLEMADIHLETVSKKGPAILFEQVKGSPFRAVSNLYGEEERARFLFRNSFEKTKKLLSFKGKPDAFLKSPFKLSNLKALAHARHLLPKKVKSAPILYQKVKVSQVPQIKSWPNDGGAFITLGQVFSLNPDKESIQASNLGMYRVQMSGGQYKQDEEIGLHYQIHRTIGVHHAKAIEKKAPLKVSIFVGGPPSHSLAAVMPAPENLSELYLAGLLGNRRFRYLKHQGHILSADADFCFTGTIIDGKELPEGPFGDHLGYYSMIHPFPVMKVENVYCKKDAIWPFTVVGRPPQEDSFFGKLIHELTSPLIPSEVPGLHALHAVDAAGVHPLLLAIGSERYTPYQKSTHPQETLTIANAILGFGQCSLAKYLFITAKEDNRDLDIHDIRAYLKHLLERVDFRRDLHFQTKTSIDTLDYTGETINRGSKLVIAAVGDKKRELGTQIPSDLQMPEGYTKPQVIMDGILAIEGPSFQKDIQMKSLKDGLALNLSLKEKFPLIILCDDSVFTAKSLDNFTWVTFTRSNPSHDVHGVNEHYAHKHWGCLGSLIIDARIKPHHAPQLTR